MSEVESHAAEPVNGTADKAHEAPGVKPAAADRDPAEYDADPAGDYDEPEGEPGAEYDDDVEYAEHDVEPVGGYDHGAGYADEGDDGEESDEYDFEEEQQAPEGDEDTYEYEEEEGGEPEGAQQNGHQPSLTALLLGDPNGGAEDEEEDQDHDSEEDYDDEEEYAEEEEDVAPITPTSKKRSIHDALDEGAPEEKEAKKVKA